jgi:phage virion morphogenesis protein
MIDIEIKDQQVTDALNRLLQAGTDLSGPLANIAQLLESETERQFRAEAGPAGPWPDLAESTKAQRARQGKWPGLMLQLTASGLAPSVQSGYDSDSAWIGSNKPYAAIHQFGGQAGRGKNVTIPARPYLPITADGELPTDVADDILDILQRHLDSALKG